MKNKIAQDLADAFVENKMAYVMRTEIADDVITVVGLMKNGDLVRAVKNFNPETGKAGGWRLLFLELNDAKLLVNLPPKAMKFLIDFKPEAKAKVKKVVKAETKPKTKPKKSVKANKTTKTNTAAKKAAKSILSEWGL